jgi:serine/threonine protein kinase
MTHSFSAIQVVAIEHLHRRNIIHRDVKPGNVLFDDGGHLVLADFGLAKIFESDRGAHYSDVSPTCGKSDRDRDSQRNSMKQSKTIQCVTNDVCGTPFYMTPEMHYGENYSFDADYWAMGVTLYRMLTGGVCWTYYPWTLC